MLLVRRCWQTLVVAWFRTVIIDRRYSQTIRKEKAAVRDRGERVKTNDGSLVSALHHSFHHVSHGRHLEFLVTRGRNELRIRY